MTASSEDALLQSLLALCRYHGNASSGEALVGGLPLENRRLTPALFERAASRVGLVSRILPRSARDVEPAEKLLAQESGRVIVCRSWVSI